MSEKAGGSRKGKSNLVGLLAASADVNNLGMSVRAAAKKYGVAKSTLADRVSGRIPLDATDGRKSYISFDNERKLITVAQERAKQGIGFSKASFLRYAGDIAKKGEHSFKNGTPSDKWWRLLKGRHNDLSLRTPEKTASIRHEMMTRERVSGYFTSMNEVLSNASIINMPSKIWNMDETYITLAEEPEKIVARKGAKYLHSKVGSRETITLIACGNAEGVLTPPHFIFKGKTKMALRSWDTENAPSGTMMSVSATGWTKQGLALLWFEKVFLKTIGSQRPQALIFDGHDSHHHVEIINSAIKNNIILIELPSHTSNWLQPLDRTFFGPMKMKWRKQLSDLMAETACTVSHVNFFRLFSKVWESMVGEPEKLRNGFAATGICPFNPSAIPNEAYEPSKLYSRKTSKDSESPASTGTDKTDVVPVETTVNDATSPVQSDNVAKSGLDKACDTDLSTPLIGLSGDPLLSFSLVDLNCSLKDDGTLVHDVPSSRSSDNQACPPDLALAAIECSLTTQKRSEYLSAFNRKADIPGDRVYQTWKLYKTQLQEDESDDALLEALSRKDNDVDIFPSVHVIPQKRKTEEKRPYFVLTSKEAYKDKLEALQRKEEKNAKKLKTRASKQLS